MIPKLLDNSKTLSQLALDQSEGLGRLSEATSAKVTEERNGQFVLELKLPITAKHYQDIVRGSIVLAKPNTYEDPQMFRISKSSKPINGVVTFTANHITYDLNKTSVAPFTAVGAALACAELKSNMTGGSDFSISTDITNNTSRFTNKMPQSFRALLGGQAGSMLDVFGGEYRWDNLDVHLLAHRGADRGVVIRYGKNLTDLKQEESIDSMYTAVMPFVKMSEADDAIVGDLQTMIVSSNPRILNLDLTSDFNGQSTPTKAQINARAQSYIEANDLTSPRINLTVSFVNLADTEEYKNIQMIEQIRLCDEVTVVFEKLGVNAKAKVIKTVFDVLSEKYISIELGNARTNIAQTLVEISEAVTDSEGYTDRAVARATQLITGGLGGYVVIGQNADGQPEEILIMDNLNKTLAVNVIRINKNGIGFSTTGYAGTYTNAWTIDGQLVADFIKTGNLNANLLTVGTIADDDTTNYWNLETGELKITGDALVGAKTLDTYVGDVVDDAIDDFDEDLDQAEVFKRLTNNGAIQGLYMENNQLYINAAYIKSGTLVLGGLNNQNGILRINNASGTQIGKWDKDGIDIEAGRIRQTNNTAWLEISSAQMTGGYTNYNGTARCDLTTTINYDGTRLGAASLSHSSGYASIQGPSSVFIIGSELQVGYSWSGGVWTGISGTVNGIKFVNGIAVQP